MHTEAASRTAFETFLRAQGEADWARAVDSLSPDIHEVDRAATQIWFAFYPLSLLDALERAEEPERLAQRLLLQGDYLLKDQIDTSHTFLYGHRFWPQVKTAVADYAQQFQPDPGRGLAEVVRDATRRATAATRADESLLLGVTAVAFMTIRHAGLSAFKSTPGRVSIDAKHAQLSPEQVLNARAKDDSQGPFGFLRTVNKVWTVTFDENRDDAKFRLINGQDMAWAAAADKRNYKEEDSRRTEGPIPVECRNASCGTCWVGVLGGSEKLAPVSPRERRMMKEFGYLDTDEERPRLRLSCITAAEGAVSIVIPPWNGFFGKYLQKQKNSAATGETETEANA
jgi:ferredoxin